MRKLSVFCLLLIVLAACGNNTDEESTDQTGEDAKQLKK